MCVMPKVSACGITRRLSSPSCTAVGDQVPTQDTGATPAAPSAHIATPAPTSRPVSQREVEHKLRVHALYRLPALTAETWGVVAVEQAPPRLMTAVYHDTEDLTLIRWGVTLRRREGGPDAGWHLKLPVAGAPGTTRDEIHVPLAHGEIGDPPIELVDLVTVLLRGAPLHPLVTVRTQRQPYLLRNGDEQPVVELVDDVVEIVHGGTPVERFREIEVEGIAVDGVIDEQLMAEVVALLVAAGATPSSVSKAAGALGPAAAAPPDVPEPAWPHRQDPAGDMVRAFIATHVRRLLWQDIRWRRRLPDAVHQMRVACRRLRAGLRTFESLVDAEWATPLRDDLAWLARELGDARDREVLHARMTDHLLSLSPALSEHAAAVIDPWFVNGDSDPDSQVDAVVRSSRYADLMCTLVAAAVTPPLTEDAARPCREVLPPCVRTRVSKLSRAVALLTPDTPSEHWHEVRLLAKRARYAAEAVSPVVGRRFEDLAEALEQVTEILGEHQDACLSGALMEQLADQSGIDPRSAYALGLLRAEETARQSRARAEFVGAWRDVVKAARKADVLSGKAAARG